MFAKPAQACTAVLLGTGCGTPPPVEADFDGREPASRMAAIAVAARSNDLDAVPRLVEQLDSGDPAVRMAAAQALKRITGETYDFEHDGTPADRGEAVDRWVDAVDGGRVLSDRGAPPNDDDG